MTDIERFLFQGVDSSTAPFISSLSFADGSISLSLIAIPDKHPIGKFEFKEVKLTHVWFDEQDPVEWPLEIIGFDSYATGDSWRFVLNCASVELGWESRWPAKINESSAAR